MVARLTELRRPFIVAVIVARRTADIAGAMSRCSYAGADAFELNLPIVEEGAWDGMLAVISGSTRPVYTSCRRAAFMSVYGQGDAPQWSDEERMARQLALLEHGSVAIDIELDAFDQEQSLGVTKSPGAVARQIEIVQAAHSLGGDVLFSCHATRPLDRDAVLRIVEDAGERGGDLAKIVAPTEHEVQALELLAAAVDVRRQGMLPTTVIAAGRTGRFTRLVSPVLGESWALCQERIDDGGFPDQPPVAEAREALRILGALQHS